MSVDLERLHGEIKRRTRAIGAFPDRGQGLVDGLHGALAAGFEGAADLGGGLIALALELGELLVDPALRLLGLVAQPWRLRDDPVTRQGGGTSPGSKPGHAGSQTVAAASSIRRRSSRSSRSRAAASGCWKAGHLSRNAA